MNVYQSGPLAAVLDAAYGVLDALVHLFEPVAGTAAAAAAIIVVTILVRAALIPVGVSQRKAELTRQRLAPRIAELRRRHGSDAQALQRETMKLYADEGVSPTAGCLPLLLQAPVLSIVYSLFVVTTINGHANALLSHGILGISLGAGLPAALAGGAVAAVALFALLAGIIAAVALVSRRLLGPTADVAPTGVLRLVGFLPLSTAVVALFVPLAAGLYLAITVIWTLAERLLLRRLLPA